MTPRPIVAATWLGALALGWIGPMARAEGPEPTADQARFFESKIRPVLVEQCSKCHGAAKQKAGLRVDSRAALLKGGDTGAAVVPGKLADSLLVAAIAHGEEIAKMPPARKLPDPVIADLRRWVEMGAPWPGGEAQAPAATNTPAESSGLRPKGPFQLTDQDRAHWAFQPIRKPNPPAVPGSKIPVHPIDAFLAAKLQAKGLAESPPADRSELIRRATYDLTGLPPTPEEVQAFADDRSPAAFENVVDRLLASPRYGEKWGRHWLDLVRFAETNSYERDGAKPNAWRYRDYVIRALNADKPFDRFAREQLAGDELADGGNDGLIATGYYRLGIWDDEPSDRDQARFDGYDDIVATTSQVFLGLTVDCARCHDHKLDPIPQKDYYRLVSFFRNVTHYRNGGPTDEQPIPESGADREKHQAKVRDLTRRRNEVRSEAAKIESNYRARFAADRRETVAREPDLEDLQFRYYRDSWDVLPDFDGLKPETKGPAPRPLFDIGLRSRDDAFGFVFEGNLVVRKAGPHTFELDSDDGSRLSIDGKELILHDGIHGEGDPHRATIVLAAGRHPIRLDYFQRSHGLGLTVSWSGPGFKNHRLSTSPDDKDRLPGAKRPEELAKRIAQDGPRLIGDEATHRHAELADQFKAIQAEIEAGPKALCVTEAGSQAPETFVLLRGNPQTPGDKVEPAFLQVLGGVVPAIPTPGTETRTTGRRTALADWIVARDNPLTPRVLANRVWQYHFGRGIVRSSSNFGLQGEKPTHPELLDWLASELLANGYRLKPLHKLIMTSAAYQMASRSDARAVAVDPANDLFWRFDPRRLTAEEVRDSILAVSGDLNLQMYGPGVYPAIPAEVMAGQSRPGDGWGTSPPDQQNRRSIYVHVKRSLLIPILESFDAAETDRSSPVRFATTQPTQALAMINGAFLHEQAAALARRLDREAGTSDRSRVALALKLVTSRSARDAEVQRGVDLVARLEKEGMAPDAALRSFCLLALNLNEFIFVD